MAKIGYVSFCQREKSEWERKARWLTHTQGEKIVKTHELQSAFWREDGLLEVAYRTKSFFAGSSHLICESMDQDKFIGLFGRKSLPPKPQK